MKKNNYILILSFISLNLFCQIRTGSLLTSEKYFNNPVKYLSKLDKSKISTGILIDKSYYSDNVFQYNGKSQVRTCQKSEWFELYYTFKYALSDTGYFPSVKSIRETNEWYNESKICPIAVLDLEFNRITKEALNNKDFIEESDHLTDNHSSINSYSNHRFISASALSKYIYGDNISFILPRSTYLSNREDWEIFKIEIDFGNGFGYENINLDEAVNIQYNSSCEDILVKLKIISNKIDNNVKDTVYSHFTFFRKGSDLIPLPDNINQSNLKSTVPIPDVDEEYYPLGTPETIRYCRLISQNYMYCEDRIVMTGRKISYFIIFNPGNTSNKTKLRRPFIVCDGFDPNDSKNYYTSSNDEVDGRGMYEILNGNPSKNEKDPKRPSANLVSKLQARGYDLVFVNFLDGAGDIPSNAEALRGFLNDIINNKYRDEKTEEAILVGPSMGGLITRYALSKMEEQGEEHYIRQWISFDSPHKGANVSIGFQWLINYFSKIHTGGIGKLEDAKEQFSDIIDMINLPAAKQMVLQHYSQLGEEGQIKDNEYHMSVGPHPDFQTFYDSIELLNNGKGYPAIPKRYAISNGGKAKRYNEDGAEIAKFKFDYEIITIPAIYILDPILGQIEITPAKTISLNSWTYASAFGNHNTDGDYKIFDGHRQDDAFDGGGTNDNDYCLYTSGQIGYENAPGGGYAMNGLLNSKDENGYDVPDDDPQYKSFTFMPTPTTFGVKVTRDNVYKTWDVYEQNNTTPFDYVHGMPENEEHVQITANTADVIVIKDIIEADFNNLVKPYNRLNENNTQNVSGKVAYKAANSITFAGNGNGFNIKNGAKVNAKSGNKITFLPGFRVENGAEFTASIETISLNQQSLKNANTYSRKAIDYTKPLEYGGKLYDYSSMNSEIEIPKEVTPFSFSVYPNPTDNFINILINPAYDIINNKSEYKIYNTQGQVLQNEIIDKSQFFVDLSHINSGIYFIKIINNDNIFTKRIIKN